MDTEHCSGRRASLLAAAVSVALVAAACGQSTGQARQAAVAESSTVSLADFPSLNSEQPLPQFAEGGGGLVGGEWTVPGMPGAAGPDDKGVPVELAQQSQAGGVRVRLTALANREPTQFVVRDAESKAVVWDSAANAATCVNSAKGNRCSVPAGVLSVGGNYMVDTTNKGVTERRMFSVFDTAAVSGSVNVGQSTRKVAIPQGEFSIGVAYSSAQQGVTPATSTKTGFSGGLPPGWSWTGIPGGIAGVTVSDAQGYQGFNKLLTVRMGAATVVLGCEATPGNAPDQCSPMAGAPPGAAMVAMLPKNAERAAVVTDQESGSNWSFDNLGRMIEYSASGTKPVQISYRDGQTSSFSKIAWNGFESKIYYSEDGDQCDSGTAPPGFVSGPQGYACAIEDAGGNWLRLLYTQPDGAKYPRLSRIMGLPSSCKWDYRTCNPLMAQIADFGWDSANRLHQSRDSQGSVARLAGVLPAESDPARDASVSLVEFDELGRVKAVTVPTPDVSLSRQKILNEYREYDLSDSVRPATRSVSSTRAPLDGSVPPSKSTYYYDDRSHGIVQDEGGTLTTFVWDDLDGRQLATISNGKVVANQYDRYGGEIGSARGPSSAFNLSKCRPDNPVLDNESCAPTDKNAVAWTATKYDQPGRVAPGLRALWFDDADFSGAPHEVTAANSVDPESAAPGFPIEAPAGVGDDWSLRLVGAVKLEPHQYGVRVLTGDEKIEGSLWIDGYFCGVVSGGQASCGFDNSATSPYSSSDPMQLRLDLTRSSGGGEPSKVASIIVQDEDSGSEYALTNDQTQQRFHAVTETASFDPLQDGAKAVRSTVAYFHDDATADVATRVQSSGTSFGGAPWNQPEVRSQFERVADGGARLVAQTSATGEVTKFTYWGDDDTLAKVNVSNLDEIPGGFRDVRQAGAIKSVTDPTGRTTTFAYDQYGDQRCISYSNDPSGSAGHWTCLEVDELARPVSSTARSEAGAAEIRTETSYKFGQAVGEPLMTTTTTTTRGGGDKITESSASSASGDLLTYVDASGTTTKYKYDAAGRMTGETIQPKGRDGGEYPPAVVAFSYAPEGLLSEVVLGGKVAAKIKYGRDKGQAAFMSGVDYGNGLSLKNSYNERGQLDKQKWTLADKSVVNVSATATLAGMLVGETFDGTVNTFDFDGGQRLSHARVGGKDFTYGWDDSSKRVCAAIDVANKSGAACDGVAGKFTYSYDGERLVSTTDPQSTISGLGAYNADGGLTKIGDVELAYDAAKQLMSAKRATGESISVTRDASGRIMSGTVTEPASSASPSATPSPSQSATQPSAPPPAATGGAAPSENVVTSTPAPSNGVTPDSGSGSPERSAAAEPGVADPAPTAKTVGLGYSTPSGPPIVRYTDKGPELTFELPGGLIVGSGELAITSPSGLGTLVLNADGTRNTGAAFSGPFGEDSAQQPPAAQLESLFVDSGARTLSSRLGQFIQPDPSVFARGPQYAFTLGDPINYHDPSGYGLTSKRKGLGPGWQMALNFGLTVVSTLISGGVTNLLISKVKWFQTSGVLQRAAVMFLYIGVNMGMTVLGTFFSSGLSLANTSSITWLFNSVMATVSGVIGFGSWKNKMAAHEDLMVFKKALMDSDKIAVQPLGWIVKNSEIRSSILINPAIVEVEKAAENVVIRMDKAGGAGKNIAAYSGAQPEVIPQVTTVVAIPGLVQNGMVKGSSVAYMVGKVPGWISSAKNYVTDFVYKLAYGH